MVLRVCFDPVDSVLVLVMGWLYVPFADALEYSRGGRTSHQYFEYDGLLRRIRSTSHMSLDISSC